MFLLIDNDNFINACADRIVWGTYEGQTKWELTDDEGKLLMYVLDHDYLLVEYNGEVPGDILSLGKYLYSNGSIVPNPDWVAPPPTEEERIAALEQTLADQDALLADILLSI